MKEDKKKIYSHISENPGVYFMKDTKGRILYIGKAGNLRRRVSSYFSRPQSARIEKMVSQIKSIDFEETDTALEALILEANLIKKYQPPFNVLEKDDKSFLYVEFTREDFPRILLVRGKSLATGTRFGPFLSGRSIRLVLHMLRKIFPYSMHKAGDGKACFDYQIGLCPGTCVGAISKKDYKKNIENIKLIFQGKKRRLITSLEKDMKVASDSLEFEKAGELRKQIFALRHIQDVALINEDGLDTGEELSNARIEGYDISNISGTSAVGSMIVFSGGKPNKNEYRKFKIRTIRQSNDVGMLKEVLRRRFSHSDWPIPDLVLIDGGIGQVNAAREIIGEAGVKVPIIGIAKGPKRKKNEFVGSIPSGFSEKNLVAVRDEAHRFAISYHRAIRGSYLKRAK
ncbi:MAG: hypothetical protein COU07_00685 [Candidatus Harrisonbacteria bacterium CG10_big_fil_rev_8_21_14_0_10_40_38]|uniref:Excinuclease ABC subunit C n=1 Tax=Candidatus Harrisonbacteria bacterium CG10_big_fil_rev_8_21_14_0_10_40_38 TaxID=1974583 RepID=A0A2H0USN6_9BACT|nr:MAG: hypothetical protein COU07_00685 [Candidatus Harrisonbacteria bacterium CG10_big_fil_rev_8_21_14_0_10_40_38]